MTLHHVGTVWKTTGIGATLTAVLQAASDSIDWSWLTPILIGIAVTAGWRWATRLERSNKALSELVRGENGVIARLARIEESWQFVRTACPLLHGHPEEDPVKKLETRLAADIASLREDTQVAVTSLEIRLLDRLEQQKGAP